MQQVFNALRVWAIWGQRWYPVVIVLPLALIPAATNAVCVSFPLLTGDPDMIFF